MVNMTAPRGNLKLQFNMLRTSQSINLEVDFHYAKATNLQTTILTIAKIYLILTIFTNLPFLF